MHWPIPEWRRREWRETMARMRSGPPIRLVPTRSPDGPSRTPDDRAGDRSCADSTNWMRMSEARRRTRPDGSTYFASAWYTYWG